MRLSLSAAYERVVLDRPIITLLVTSALVALIGTQSVRFELDASAEALFLENDDDLRYYRSVGARYGSDDSLIITYTPKSPLFSKATLANLRQLRDRLLELERVESVISILDVPLIRSPKVSLAEIRDYVRTLESADTDIDLARAELLASPLYGNLIISPDGKTTALQVLFRRDETFESLLKRRDALREKQLTTELSADELEALAVVSDDFKQYSAALLDRESEDIVVIRAIMDEHRGAAKLFLGGVPMIASDMIDFIRHDLVVFGVGVLCFLIALLAVSFRKARWVFLPLCCCFAAVLFMFGFLGLMGWKVTVVSSNFTSLLLIITLSLTIHLIVRYHELHVAAPKASQRTLVLETVRTKALPSLYTALTTIVAFGSLLLSHIRPVIDFGWMMAIGITVAFSLSFVLFPAALMLLKPVQIEPRWSFTGKLTRAFVTLIDKHGNATLLVFLLLIALSAMGISQLTVENRFIDHFKESTEIYRGMEMIDRELGGTTPLDIIVDADPAFYASVNPVGEFEDAFEDGTEWNELLVQQL